MAFDLDLYLERIRLAERPQPDAAGLLALQRAHRLAIPFENLDIFLGRAIRVDSDSVFAKLVTARRGGYCFEHNRLFLDALDALGFQARPLLARVWLGAEHVPPLTHAISLVTIDSVEWVADTGFGGSYVPPMPLADGEEAVGPDGARFRLSRDPAYGWMLDRHGDPATTDGRASFAEPEVYHGAQYSFGLETVYPSDMALGNHWTSTAPGTRFTTLRLASLVLPNGFASLNDRNYHRRNSDNEAHGEITDPRVYRMRLSMMFGIDMTVDEVAQLGLFATT
jgi:N-hydroxyarylamine O-acetyltransferase